MIPTYAFPFFAAILYGLNYAILGRVLQSLSIATFVLYSTLFGLIFAASAIGYRKNSLDLSMPIHSPSTAALLFIAVAASWGAWLLTSTVTKHISPTYAAIGEVAYPIFVPIFAYLLFREKQWDWSTVAGGGLIFMGLFILIFSKIRGS